MLPPCLFTDPPLSFSLFSLPLAAGDGRGRGAVPAVRRARRLGARRPSARGGHFLLSGPAVGSSEILSFVGGLQPCDRGHGPGRLGADAAGLEGWREGGDAVGVERRRKRAATAAEVEIFFVFNCNHFLLLFFSWRVSVASVIRLALSLSVYDSCALSLAKSRSSSRSSSRRRRSSSRRRRI